MVSYKDFNILSENQVKNLYMDAGWTNYTKDIKTLLFGIQNSSFVYSAWVDHQLVGLVRTVSDNHTICYIQDLLVLKDFRGQGIGKNLINKVLETYKHVRQIILTTDLHGPSAFYERLGFKAMQDQSCKSYIYVRKNT